MPSLSFTSRVYKSKKTNTRQNRAKFDRESSLLDLKFHGTLRLELQKLQSNASADEILAVFLRKLRAKLFDAVNAIDPLSSRGDLVQIVYSEVVKSFFLESSISSPFLVKLEETASSLVLQDFKEISDQFKSHRGPLHTSFDSDEDDDYLTPVFVSPAMEQNRSLESHLSLTSDFINQLCIECESFVHDLGLQTDKLKSMLVEQMRQSAENKKDAMIQLQNFREIQHKFKKSSRMTPASIQTCSRLLSHECAPRTSIRIPAQAWITICGFVGTKVMFGGICGLNRALFKLCHSSILWNDVRAVDLCMPWFPAEEDMDSLFSRLDQCKKITNISNQWSRKAIDLIVLNCAQIVHLDLSDCFYLGLEEVKLIANSCLRVETLVVNRCLEFVSPQSISLLSRSLSESLVKFEAQDCALLTFQSIEHLFRCRELKSFQIPLTVDFPLDTSPLAIHWSHIDQMVQAWPELTELDLSRRSPLVDPISRCNPINAIINGLDSLERLVLRHWSGFNASNVMQMHICLREIDLSFADESMTDSLIVQLSKSCIKLTKLSLDNTFIGDEAIVAIADSCRDLSHFDISGTFVSEKSLKKLVKNCQRIQTLYLDNCNISDSSLYFVSKLDQLTHLSISKCIRVTDSGIGYLCQSAAKIRSLKIADLPRLTDRSLEMLSRTSWAVTGLEEISLGKMELMTLEGLKSLRSLQSLRRFSAIGARRIDTEGMLLLGTSAFRYSLEMLDMSFCENVNNNVIQAVCALLSNLQEIRLSHCPRITNASVFTIINSLDRLVTLDVSSCSSLTSECIKPLKQLCQNAYNLRTVSFRDCAAISPTLRQDLDESLTHVRIL